MSSFITTYTVTSIVLMTLTGTCFSQRRCLKAPEQPELQCAKFFYGEHMDPLPPFYSTVPNGRNLDHQQAIDEFSGFSLLLHTDNYCSYLLHSFLCIHYFPPCDPNDEQRAIVRPCRAVCEEAMAECLDRVYDMYNISRPEHLECENFPEDCPESDDSESLVACPAPAIHFDFDLQFGQRKYTVLESDGLVEVCVKVASTGRHKELQCPVYVDISTCSDTATGDDYSDSNKHKLVFEKGSIKDEVRCASIAIIDDVIEEFVEMFYVHAHMYTNGSWPASGQGTVAGSGSEGSSESGSSSDNSSAPDELHFGGALNSPTGRVEVAITDNDVCHIPQRYCSNKCRQRENLGMNTFVNNNYTYAARIELLGFTKYNNSCTGIEARVIQCWELRRNVCPFPNSTYVIPTCANCPKLSLVEGNHYLIAGVRHRIQSVRRLILPGLKSTGLFLPWGDCRSADIDTWVKSAKAG